MFRPFLAVLLTGFCATAGAFAQTANQSYAAELSIPFGTAAGRLVATPDHLIFIDEQQPQFSFALHPQDIREASREGGMLSLQLSTPVRDRSGERSRITFRVNDSGAMDALTGWAKGARGASGEPTAARSSAGGDVLRYSVEHAHFVGGSCNGQLMVEPDRIVFESLTSVDHSRQWALRDIKQMKRDSPYRLRLEPFTGGDYNFRVSGQGIDNNDFEIISQRVASERSRR